MGLSQLHSGEQYSKTNISRKHLRAKAIYIAAQSQSDLLYQFTSECKNTQTALFSPKQSWLVAHLLSATRH